jgi:broad specificity phosphatase PhoE
VLRCRRAGCCCRRCAATTSSTPPSTASTTATAASSAAAAWCSCTPDDLAELGFADGDELAGLTDVETDERLWEWDYGAYEGRTTPEIREERPGWYLWRDGVIGGETAEQVAARVDGVLDVARPRLADGDVALVAHGHVLRVLAARWLGLPPADGRLFKLSTGTLSTLGTEHDVPVVTSWNVPA